VICHRCHDPIPEGGEHCWYCTEPCLCGYCWDEHGHCGHPEADAIDARMRTASPRERETIVRHLDPEAEWLRGQPS
jgi:hypothetical protein